MGLWQRRRPTLQQISLRLTDEILARAGKLAPKLSKRSEYIGQGQTLTRSDVIRIALYQGLAGLEELMSYKPFPNVRDGQFELERLEWRVVEDHSVERWRVHERDRKDSGPVFIVTLHPEVKEQVEEDWGRKLIGDDDVAKAAARAIGRATRKFREKGRELPNGYNNRVAVSLRDTDFVPGRSFSSVQRPGQRTRK